MRQTRFSWTWPLVPVLLCAFMLLTKELAQPPPPESLRPKVFVLGLSKTGTTSIGDALGQLGYKRLGWRDIRSRHMVHTFMNGDTTSLVALTRHYDAFEDLPWPFLYREMAELYPDARFILSLRRDEETWLRSMRTHLGRGKWHPHAYFYGADAVTGNEGVILQSYRNHTHDVREYFKDQPGRIAELNIDNGDLNWDALCAVARCPGGVVPTISFPRSNAAGDWDMGAVVKKLHWFWGWTVTVLEEKSSRAYYSQSGDAVLKYGLDLCWQSFDLAETICSDLWFRATPWLFPRLLI